MVRTLAVHSGTTNFSERPLTGVLQVVTVQAGVDRAQELLSFLVS